MFILKATSFTAVTDQGKAPCRYISIYVILHVYIYMQKNIPVIRMYVYIDTQKMFIQQDNSTCTCHHPPSDKKALTVLTVGWNCGRPVPCVKIAHPPHSPFSSKGEWGGFLYTLSFFVQFKPPLQTTLFQAVGGWEKNLAGVRILKPIDIRLEPKWPEGLFQPPPKQV